MTNGMEVLYDQLVEDQIEAGKATQPQIRTPSLRGLLMGLVARPARRAAMMPATRVRVTGSRTHNTNQLWSVLGRTVLAHAPRVARRLSLGIYEAGNSAHVNPNRFWSNIQGVVDAETILKGEIRVDRVLSVYLEGLEIVVH